MIAITIVRNEFVGPELLSIGIHLAENGLTHMVPEDFDQSERIDGHIVSSEALEFTEAQWTELYDHYLLNRLGDPEVILVWKINEGPSVAYIPFESVNQPMVTELLKVFDPNPPEELKGTCNWGGEEFNVEIKDGFLFINDRQTIEDKEDGTGDVPFLGGYSFHSKKALFDYVISRPEWAYEVFHRYGPKKIPYGYAVELHMGFVMVDGKPVTQYEFVEGTGSIVTTDGNSFEDELEMLDYYRVKANRPSRR